MLNFNNGVALLNAGGDGLAQEAFTVVVSGLSRSGTSMIARLLTAGNIPMGVNCHDTIHEDLLLSTAIEKHHKRKYRKLIHQRNLAHNIWGFKRPLIVEHRALLESELRNPRFIIVFRDPLAVAIRNHLSLGFEIENALKIYQDQNRKILDFVAKTRAPLLLASYEKILTTPDGFLPIFAEFAGIEAENLANLRTLIAPNDAQYREKTRHV